MIRYTLRCDGGHEFESWFQDSAAYDRQAKRGLVTCPACDSTKVEKAIMAPRVSMTAKKRRTSRTPAGDSATQVANAPTAAGPAAPATAAMSPQEREFRSKLKELRDHITKNADNVGGKFPEEARKMHYGEIEHRPIYGEATPGEAKKLAEEGVEVHALPMLPDDLN